MNQALIMVDIQNDYFPGGRMELVGAEEAGRSAAKLLRRFRENQGTIVHIQHISLQKGASFFLPDTDGINFHGPVAPLPGEEVMRKHFPNSFLGTGLHEFLSSRKIKKLIVCGMMSHMCIDATVRAAFDQGYACLVPHDACATRGLVFNSREIPADQVHGAFMAALGAVYAEVRGTEEIIKTVTG